MRHHGVCHDDGIAVTQFEVFGKQVLLGLLVFLVDKLLRTEPAGELAPLVYSLESTVLEERTLDFLFAERLVAPQGDAVHLDLVLLVNVYIHDDLAGVCHVIALHDVDFGILETLLVEVSLGQRLGPVRHVGVNLVLLDQSQLGFQVLPFALLHTVVVDFRNLGKLSQLDMQISRIDHDAIYTDLYVGEESVPPVSLYGLGNLLTGYGHPLTNGESRESDKQIVVIVADTPYGNAGNDVFPRCA